MLVQVFGHIIDFAVNHDPAGLAGIVFGDFETVHHRHCTIRWEVGDCVDSKKLNKSSNELLH